MNYFFIIVAISLLSVFGYWFGRLKSRKAVKGEIRNLNSLPGYYGFYVAFWSAIPAILLLTVWGGIEPTFIIRTLFQEVSQEIPGLSDERFSLFLNEVKNLADGNLQSEGADPLKLKAVNQYIRLKQVGFASLFSLVLAVSIAGLAFALKSLSPSLPARDKVETVVKVLMILCSSVAILTTVGIVLSVIFEALRFFQQVGVTEFLFGLKWSPQMAIREDQVGAAGAFGVIPLFAGTLMISAIAMSVAVPTGLMSAIYLSEYAKESVRTVVKPLLEILAGIPTVVYGFFAALTVSPFIRDLGARFGADISSESALSAGLVMGVMIIPFVSSLSDDVINAVPQSLRDASLGIGATRSETVIHVVLPAALPGIVSSTLLAVSRAIGETMIVVMAAGLTANLTANPFQSVTTMTVQIVTLLVGDQEFDSPKTLAAFAIGLLLFFLTLTLNIVALAVVRRFRERYE
ncbi:MAG: phosphate ABC transporter permease subunit PstC [Nitrospinota bacterium]